MRESETKKWIIAVTVVFGAFMAVMDISVVNVALPHMMGSFSQDLSTITWVATGYSIAEIITISMAGWGSALLGRKRLYLISFAVFTMGSILCGTATSFPQMIVYRIIQGLGGGALVPVSQAILRENFKPEEQGMAMALFGMGVVLAPALGPVLGGWITDHWGWPWIFYINIPISIAGIILVITFVEDPDYLKRGVNRVDWIGILLLTVSLTFMQYVLERGQEKNWLESRTICIGIAVTLISGAALIFWELKAKEPVMNLRVLKNRSLAIGSAMGLIFGVALFGTTFILPQFTQQLLGYSAFQAGLILAPRAAMLVLFMPVAGRLYRHIDVRALICFAVFVIVWAYYDLSRLSLSAGFNDIVPTLIIMGIGMPFMFVPLSTTSLSTVEKSDMTHATSFYTLSRRIGGNIGYAVAATLVARGQQIHHADLVTHITPSNPNYMDFLHRLSSAVDSSGAGALAVVDRIIRQQATMMAYNDISVIFAFLFISILPLVFMLPSQRRA